MLDFSHLAIAQGADIQVFSGDASATLAQWQTWRKPRGDNWVYILAVGGGSSGGCGTNSAATGGGGAGGGSGSQTGLLIPAAFVPDILYIQAGMGGRQPATLVSAAVGVAGLITYVNVEPDTSVLANMTLVFAPGGSVTGAATTTTGGTAGAASAVATIANMPLAGRGFFTLFAGQAGAAGGASAPTAGANITLPATGLMVSGGAGGGGSTTTGAAGGNITGIGLGSSIFPTLAGGGPAVTTVSAFPGSSFMAPNFLMNYGGSGGGGATTTGGIAGPGGIGAPGCGGGGAGASNTTDAALQRPGDGGDGFVIIMSF